MDPRFRSPRAALFGVPAEHLPVADHRNPAVLRTVRRHRIMLSILLYLPVLPYAQIPSVRVQ